MVEAGVRVRDLPLKCVRGGTRQNHSLCEHGNGWLEPMHNWCTSSPSSLPPSSLIVSHCAVSALFVCTICLHLPMLSLYAIFLHLLTLSLCLPMPSLYAISLHLLMPSLCLPTLSLYAICLHLPTPYLCTSLCHLCTSLHHLSAPSPCWKSKCTCTCHKH